MSRSLLTLVASVLCGALLVPVEAEGAKPESKDPGFTNPDVLRALRAEVAGAVDRRSALGEVLRGSTSPAAARWQAGYVRDGDVWRSFDDPQLTADRLATLEQYRAQRAAAPATANGQLQLANWCRQHGLADQEQAHLHALLSLDPQGNHGDILLRLGFRQVGGQWLSRAQLLEWRELNRQAEASLKRFGTPLERIAKQLAGTTRQRTAGEAALRQINDPAAIPAIEYTFAGRDEASALAAVAAFDRLEGFEASVALARQGVFSKWPAVRTAAATALKTRRLDDFAPQLIALMAGPVRSEFRVLRRPWDRDRFVDPAALLYSYVISRETEDQFQVATLNTMNLVTDDYVTTFMDLPPRSETAAAASRIGIDRSLAALQVARGRNDAELMIRDQLQARERVVAEFNLRTEELNGRIGAALAGATHAPVSSDANVWWNWLDAHFDQTSTAGKQVVRVDEYEVQGNVGRPPPMMRSCECFAAGTPIRTESGLLAIEEVQVGDRVLAKDIETGELSYKPVLQLTRRPPKELTALRFENETLVCTGGHQFWISGSGWVKARDISPDSLIHTPWGNRTVWSAKKRESAETYNLVVADFHTYFVGTSGLLCHDVVRPRSTNKVVPGLDRGQSVAGGQ